MGQGDEIPRKMQAMRSDLRMSLFAASVYVLLASAQSTCWYPDGETKSETDVPCDPNADVSPCCGSESYCMDNGLCFDSGSISRGSCTDPSWGDGCTPYCIHITSSCSETWGCTVFGCNAFERNFTCGYPSNCESGKDTFIMEGGQAIVLRPTQVALLQPASSSSAVTLPPTGILSIDPALQAERTQATVTVAASNTAEPTGSDSGCSSDSTLSSDSSNATCAAAAGHTFTAGQVAGASAGTGIPLLLALAAAGFVILRQRKRINQQTKNYEPVPSIEHRQPSEQPPQMGASDQWWQQQRPSQNWSPEPPHYALSSPSPAPNGRTSEMEALHAQKVEMDAQRDPTELGSSR